jgi:hypothetical protein
MIGESTRLQGTLKLRMPVASRVVLPEPAGAETMVSRWRSMSVQRLSTGRDRTMISGRGAGGENLVIVSQPGKLGSCGTCLANPFLTALALLSVVVMVAPWAQTQPLLGENPAARAADHLTGGTGMASMVGCSPRGKEERLPQGSRSRTSRRIRSYTGTCSTSSRKYMAAGATRSA